MPSYLSALNTDYIEELERKYKTDPRHVEPTWRFFFDGLAMAYPSFSKNGSVLHELDIRDLEFEVKVLELIQGYRERGYLIADVNPLQRGIKTHPLLHLSNFGLQDGDLDRVCNVGRVLGMGAAPLKSILVALTSFYCSPVSVEYGHMDDDPKSREWIQKRVESNFLIKPLSAKYKQRVYEKLCEAEALETFLHKRFVGGKRFSLEGNDAIIPMLDFLIDEAAQLGADELILGMAHRGRLNVLSNIFEKEAKLMLAEFLGNLDINEGEGDVKYHMGFSQNTKSFGGKPVHLSLMPNPSHLEAINPVLLGVTRAKQKLKGDLDRSKTLPVMIHGDASFAGQGVVYEILNMSDLKGYTVGGTVHIILNNQVGFTTAPHEARSTPQATDVAKMLEIPIFHVNADEPEAAMRCTSLALQYRYKFKRDVVIDLVGYRRYGHNEGDEPTFTHPLMYKTISGHPRVRDLYAQKLVQGGTLDDTKASGVLEGVHQRLEDALSEAKKSKITNIMSAFGDRWKTLTKVTEKSIFQKAVTGVPIPKLKRIGEQLLELPPNFRLHPKLQRLLEDRRSMLEGLIPVDWSLAEALAYGSLMCEGFPVRVVGQDAERGTFSHRHSVFHDVENGLKYTPLNHVEERQGDFEIINSLLSEYGALGFEFGQSLANPNKLTIWEAQFGDFINGAQIIIDQFITCSAVKWQRYSGLVMLLPHGYEGQGPEHSSARLERFLQACAKNNIQVCNLTTPAQLFHALRRQLLRDFRMPLIIMSPKSLLRHPAVVSPFEEFEKGYFKEVLDDGDETLRPKAKRIVLCSGKIYYELLEARQAAKKDVAVIRLEQLYPFPKNALNSILQSYKQATEIVWCQEGPQNMEGWFFMAPNLQPLLKPEQTLTYVGRAAQASPADGYMHLHIKEQKKIVQTALGEAKSE